MAETCAGWTYKNGEREPCRFGDDVPRTNFGGENYCDYHLPMGEAGGGGKTDWGEAHQDAFTAGLIGRIKAQSKAQLEKPEKLRGDLDFRGVVVPGAFRLSGETIWALNMRGAQFHGNAWFNEAEFHGLAWFGEARFNGYVVFNHAQFHGNAWFLNAEFHGDAEFNRAQFHEHAGFNRAQFHGYARFLNAEFHGDAEFNQVRFHGKAGFNEAGFNKAQFHGKAGFNEAQFHGDAGFNRAQFHGHAGFNQAQFHSDAWFSEAEFHGNAGFNQAEFDVKAEFHNARFHGDAEFKGSADPARLEARQFNTTSFRDAHFEAGANFSNREFRDETEFGGCEFGEAPNFHGSILHQDTAFGGIECFPDTASGGAGDAYRTLRWAMEGYRARVKEGMFYTLEQKARRHGIHRFDPAFWMSLCYELGSNYGFSVARPLVALVGGIIASTGLLIAVGMVFDCPCGAGYDPAAMWKDGLLFSVRQTFLPFDALRSADEILKAYSFNPGGTGWLRAWGVVLTLFEALAALLLVLAVRWRYRR